MNGVTFLIGWNGVRQAGWEDGENSGSESQAKHVWATMNIIIVIDF